MPLSGKEMLKRYKKAGWKKLRQKGSHVVVKKDGISIPIPMHKELKKGTESMLLKVLKRGK
ncbi:type II toxin-antitoxin system HicA family toxin [bacterium]|nr:type II toxin-antitoxin system HicA family toxin [Bacteroidales bacterium]MCK5685142.1 type II toxin-antitoxin system HicA family toxin [bacterium]